MNVPKCIQGHVVLGSNIDKNNRCKICAGTYKGPLIERLTTQTKRFGIKHFSKKS